jgi:dihydroorotase-like cyclic amidohydrolase
MKLLLRGGRVVDPASSLDGVRDVLIEDGRILRVESSMSLDTCAGAQVVEVAPGLVLCPGFIDMHVHLREPGYEHKETIATEVADAPNSVILEQVANGVAVRMAVLYLLAGGGEHETAA